MREAYRTNKHNLLEKLEAENKTLALMFIYNNRKLSQGMKIEEAIVKALGGLKV